MSVTPRANLLRKLSSHVSMFLFASRQVESLSPACDYVEVSVSEGLISSFQLPFGFKVR